MDIIDPHLDLTPDDVIDALRLTAGESSGPQAAGMELLIQHRTWISNAFFAIDCLTVWRDPETDEIGARIRWSRIGDELASDEPFGGWVYSTSDMAVLSIAASIAASHEVNLQHAVRGLDAHTVALVVSAVVSATRKQADVLITRAPSAASTPGRQVADWLDDVVQSGAYSYGDVTAAKATDEDLRALLVTAATGETGAVIRSRLRATRGTPAHKSAPPAVLSAIVGLPVTDREWTEILTEFRRWWMF